MKTYSAKPAENPVFSDDTRGAVIEFPHFVEWRGPAYNNKLKTVLPPWRDPVLENLAPALGVVLPFLHKEKELSKHMSWDFDCMTTGDDDEIYGWVFNRDAMRVYPSESEYDVVLPRNVNRYVELNRLNKGSSYTVEFYDTISGEVTSSGTLNVSSLPTRLDLPPFKTDVAFKLKRKPVETVEKPPVATPQKGQPNRK